MFHVTAVLLSVCFLSPEVTGHGRMIVPPGRATAWRYGHLSKFFIVNYNDNELYCGGKGVQFGTNGGKCGICGDDFRQEIPRDNERGGKKDVGLPVEVYARGAVLDVAIDLTANHKGVFYFDLCHGNDPKALETEDCFKPLNDATTGLSYYIVPSNESRQYTLKLQLPDHMTCDACVLRWKYVTGNSWGCGKSPVCQGPCGPGCGDQEHFFSCADIMITETGTEKLPYLDDDTQVVYTKPLPQTTQGRTTPSATPSVTPSTTVQPMPVTDKTICSSFCKANCKPGLDLFCLESLCGKCPFYKKFANRSFNFSNGH